METLMKMKWKIGSVEIENPFILAPMAGVTDLPFRILCKEQGAGLLCTEMVSAKAISFHNKNTISLMQIELKGEFTGIREMRKHIAWYTSGMRHSAGLRRDSNLVSSYEELEKLLDVTVQR